MQFAVVVVQLALALSRDVVPSFYGQQQQQPQSPFGVYPGKPPVYPALQLQQQSTQLGRGVGGREEIILVSDDRVLTLRLTLPGQ